MKFDLEERTCKFAKDCREYCRALGKIIYLFDDIKQLIRSSGSVGANYIEANEAVSKKDFIYRTKICRKEVKESRYWLSLLQVEIDDPLYQPSMALIQEAEELEKIFGSIIRNSTKEK